MDQGTTPQTHIRSSTSGVALLAFAGTLVGIALAFLVFGNLGGESPLAVAALCVGRVYAVLPAMVFVATGLGLGRWFGPLVKGAGESAAVRGALGMGLLLTLSHVLGQAGLLHGATGFGITLGVSAAGLGTLVVEATGLMRRPRSPEADVAPGKRASLLMWPIVRGLITGLVFVAVVSPPGALWGSEFGGYDALSYHLQLPQEWLVRGRVESLDHNVYSYLPSFMESAFVYLAALTHAPTMPEFPGGPIGLLAGSGWRAISCQALHAMFLLGASMLVAALARHLVAVGRDGSDTSARSDPARRGLGTVFLLGSALFLLTPWSIVVGALAYNEMAMLAMFAGALIVATSRAMSPARRGALSGMLVAVACGVKPTALLFVGVPTGIVLLGTMRAREWWRAILPGVGVALLFLAPWMIRNAMASGNPLFPFALTNWLGPAHWDVEQVQRFLRFHVSHEPLMDRVKLLVLPDARDPAASPGHPVFRGMTHPQWGVFFALVAISMPHAIFWWRGRGRKLSLLLSMAIVVQVALWLLTTHVQSRFLLPLIVPGVAIVALAFATPGSEADASDTFVGPSAPLRRLSYAAIRVACWVGVLAQGGFLAFTIASQHDGHAAALLPLEPADFTMAAWHAETDPTRRDELVANSPAIGVGALVPASEKVVLLGEATPFYYPPGATYNTVWDRWPFKDGALTDATARFVLVDFGSIARFERSGYLPPGVTLRGVEAWVSRSCRVVREWREQGKMLVEVIR